MSTSGLDADAVLEEPGTSLPSPTIKTNKKKQRQKPVVEAKPKQSFHEQLSSEVISRLNPERSLLKPDDLVRQLYDNATQPSTSKYLRPQVNVSEVASIASTGFISSLSSDDISSSSSPTLQAKKSRKLPKNDGHTYTLDHFVALQALNCLIEEHGRISHMGILDPSYSFFMAQNRRAALYYKVRNKVAVVGGNPLCEPSLWSYLFQEFAAYRKKHGLGISYLGATGDFSRYAFDQKGWVSMRFGTERALNPMTNEILLNGDSKRMVKQIKALLDPKRGGMSIHVYTPHERPDYYLQNQLVEVYEAWRNQRNESGKAQAYITVYEPFAIPHLMLYVYCTDPTGKPNGFAALRRVKGGYHLDPYCAAPDAPNGTSDLLIYASLAILNRAGVSYLGLGYEPTSEVSEVHGLGTTMTKLIESAYRKSCSRLPIDGKKTFHDKWHPAPEYDSPLYILYPNGRPDLNHSLAIMHFSNVSARNVIKQELKDHFSKRKRTENIPIPAEPISESSAENASTTAKRPETSHGVPVPPIPASPIFNLRQGLRSASALPLRIGITTT